MKENDKAILRGMNICIKELETAFANILDLIGKDSWIMHNLLQKIPEDAKYEYVDGDPENLPELHTYLDVIENSVTEWLISFKEDMEEEMEEDA